MPEPQTGQRWSLEQLMRSGASFETLIGTYLEGPAPAAPPPALPGLSVHYWHLTERDADTQVPHREDELYLVLDGGGTLDLAGERRRLASGDLIFVPRGVPHRFTEVASGPGLHLLVIFSPNYTGRAEAAE